MANIYLTDQTRDVLDTLVDLVNYTAEGVLEVVLRDTIFRPAGGGQPADTGVVMFGGAEAPIAGAVKRDGKAWLKLQTSAALLRGSKVQIQIDGARRRQLSRAHTLTHIMMAAFRQQASGFASKGAAIAEDGRSVEIRFMADTGYTPDLPAAEAWIQDAINDDLPVDIIHAKDMSAALRAFPELRVDPDLGLTGKVRIVSIFGRDANPCSGTHARSTAELAGLRLGPHRQVDDFTMISAHLAEAPSGT
ncbi:MAG: hypothetical protein Q8R02_08745 [Hyphomonadaceae bacterium]|nr:hypothetical protein [Hyphomonadaceae bacterium]